MHIFVQDLSMLVDEAKVTQLALVLLNTNLAKLSCAL